MPEFRKGDRVRFSVEGIVQDVSSGGSVQLNGAYFGHQPDLDAGGKLELLERAKPKVGDRIDGEEMDRLPVGSVVRYAGGIPALWFRRSRTHWAYDLAADVPLGNQDRTRSWVVKYIPD